jgi:putative cell wall-binding protein
VAAVLAAWTVVAPVRWAGGAGRPTPVLGTGAHIAATTATPAPIRYAGGDRFQTAANISAATFSPPAPVAFIANGGTFPDALAGGPAAALDGGPLLLVDANDVPPATSAELTRLRPARIIVLGGTAVVSDAVVSTLQGDTSGTVTRLAGPDRYATAAAISAATFSPGVSAAYVATGTGFADALAGGAAAGAAKAPLLLVQQGSIPASTAAELSRLRPASIIVLGGTAAVSDPVATQLASDTTGRVAREAGADRYATAAAVSRASFPDGAAAVYLATGLDFPDALAGSVPAALVPAPVLLVPGTCVSPDVGTEINRLNPAKIVILGGDSAIGPGVDSLTPCTATTPAATGMSFPASVSANGRYLVDQSGKPYLVVGDSPQSIIADLTEPEAATYFADRQAHGFNAAWVQLLSNSYTGGHFGGSTYDGIAPFTTPGDFSTPNPAYFQRVDDIVTLAAAHGITVFLDPVDTGGWLTDIESNGAATDRAFGAYLGARYASFPNVVWINGNDFQSWMSATDDADVTAIAQGIASSDPDHLQTVELDYPASTSLDDPRWAPVVSIDAAYTYFPTYDEVLKAYNQAPVPTLMVEGNYEFENNVGTGPGTPFVLREQEYWTMTSGATGQLYGNHYTWDASSWSEEQANLDTPGAEQIGYMANLFSSGPWWELIPDQHHTLVTAGYGTYATSGPLAANDYVTAAATPDGSFAVIYLPTTATVTLDMSRLAGTVTAKWYDPTTGTYTTIGTFANTGARSFTSPAGHADGTDDWVLVL